MKRFYNSIICCALTILFVLIVSTAIGDAITVNNTVEVSDVQQAIEYIEKGWPYVYEERAIDPGKIYFYSVQRWLQNGNRLITDPEAMTEKENEIAFKQQFGTMYYLYFDNQNEYAESIGSKLLSNSALIQWAQKNSPKSYIELCGLMGSIVLDSTEDYNRASLYFKNAIKYIAGVKGNDQYYEIERFIWQQLYCSYYYTNSQTLLFILPDLDYAKRSEWIKNKRTSLPFDDLQIEDLLYYAEIYLLSDNLDLASDVLQQLNEKISNNGLNDSTHIYSIIRAKVLSALTLLSTDVSNAQSAYLLMNEANDLLPMMQDSADYEYAKIYVDAWKETIQYYIDTP